MKTGKFYSSFLAFISALCISGMVSACNTIPGIQGNGNVLKETRKVSPFNGIDVGGAFEVVLRQGTTEEVVVEADANLLPVIETVVEGSTLKIETKKPVRNATKMKVYVTFKELREIGLSGAVNLETDGRIRASELDLDLSGATESQLEIETQRLSLDCSGASKIKLTGSATSLKMDLSGASEIHAYELATENADVEISGAGNARIHVSKQLRAEVSGAGSVKYRGSPMQVDQHTSGAGSVSRAD